MPSRAHLALTALLVVGCAAAPPGRPTPRAEGPLAELAWLAGHWRATEGDRVTDEQWLAPRGGVMLGVSRTVEAGAVVHTEWLRIEARPAPGGGEPTVVYLADPSSQAPTEFTRAASGATSASFENLAHDYPQRIVYSREGERLTARIEGAAGERSASWAFEYVPAP